MPAEISPLSAARPWKSEQSPESRARAEAVTRWLQVFVLPGQITELRAIGTPDGVAAGWFDFDHLDLMARHAVALQARGIYFVPNPIRRDIDIPGLKRIGLNKLGPARTGEHTEDGHIERRLWLPIDVDPVRVNAPRRSSSTDEERAAAWAVLDRCRGALQAAGLIDGVVGDSGNGWHLCQPIDLPNDEPSREFVRQLLATLDRKCSDERAKVDTTTYNAARIWKLYGSAARKGEATADRPHRLSQLIDLPSES